jgi:hypothetical protein
MSNDQRASWEVSGYADITSATIINGELEVSFANGDIGEPKDRWGSLTNLAKAGGKGRDQVLEVFIHEFSQELITGDDQLLLKASVFNSELTV